MNKIKFVKLIGLVDGYGDDEVSLYITNDNRKFIISGHYEQMPEVGIEYNEETLFDSLNVEETTDSIEDICDEYDNNDYDNIEYEEEDDEEEE